MKCDLAQERMLTPDALDPEAARHIAGCLACREIQAEQQAVDRQLAVAFAAPLPPRTVRRSILARVSNDRRERRMELLRPFAAPVGGLVTGGIGALLAPEAAPFILGLAATLSAAGYVAQLLFVWLTEELGEG